MLNSQAPLEAEKGDFSPSHLLLSPPYVLPPPSPTSFLPPRFFVFPPFYLLPPSSVLLPPPLLLLPHLPQVYLAAPAQIYLPPRMGLISWPNTEIQITFRSATMSFHTSPSDRSSPPTPLFALLPLPPPPLRRPCCLRKIAFWS